MHQMSSCTLNVSGKQVRLARESDFRDFVCYASPAELHLAMRALKSMVENAGSVRTPHIDLARQRLSQMRQMLH